MGTQRGVGCCEGMLRELASIIVGEKGGFGGVGDCGLESSRGGIETGWEKKRVEGQVRNRGGGGKSHDIYLFSRGEEENLSAKNAELR